MTRTWWKNSFVKRKKNWQRFGTFLRFEVPHWLNLLDRVSFEFINHHRSEIYLQINSEEPLWAKSWSPKTGRFGRSLLWPGGSVAVATFCYYLQYLFAWWSKSSSFEWKKRCPNKKIKIHEVVKHLSSPKRSANQWRLKAVLPTLAFALLSWFPVSLEKIKAKWIHCFRAG